MNRILQAAHFAAIKHESQRRKNSAATPYINHPIEVAEYLNRVAGVNDDDILIAAILHDTLEDTETSEDEIRQLFGERVLGFVQECSDDKTQNKAERKRMQIATASKKSDGAKQIKTADKYCNLKSILDDPPKGWSVTRQLEYFQWAEQVQAGLQGVNPILDAEIEDVIKTGLQKLGNG